jgi:uncharacterized protein (UPF0210 family)
MAIGQANLAISNKIMDSHNNMSMMIRNLNDQVKAITVGFSKPSDIQETASLLQQRVEEDLEQPAFQKKTAVEERQYGL